MAAIDTDGIKKEVAALAASLLKGFVQQGISDANAFLAEVQDDIVELAQDKATGAISEDEYEMGREDIAALGKMEAIKQAGLAQVTIDKFTDGVIGIVEKAALAALP